MPSIFWSTLARRQAHPWLWWVWSASQSHHRKILQSKRHNWKAFDRESTVPRKKKIKCLGGDSSKNVLSKICLYTYPQKQSIGVNIWFFIGGSSLKHFGRHEDGCANSAGARSQVQLLHTWKSSYPEINKYKNKVKPESIVINQSKRKRARVTQNRKPWRYPPWWSVDKRGGRRIR